MKRKLDRLALIGGHVIEWSREGMKDKVTGRAFKLLLRGMPAVLAGIWKKVVSRFSGRPETVTY